MRSSLARSVASISLVSVPAFILAVACGGSSGDLTTLQNPADPAKPNASSTSSGGDQNSGGHSSSSSSTSSGHTSSSGSSGHTDAGADADAAAVHPAGPVSFGMCAAVTACDAPVVGNWEFTQGCLDDVLGAAREQCPGVRLDGSTGKMSGTVAFTDTEVTRALSFYGDATVFIPSDCTRGYACALIGPAIPTAIPGATGKCKDAPADGGSGCSCSVHLEYQDNSGPVGYTRAGGVVTTTAGDTFEVCAAGAALKMHSAGTTSNLPGGVSEFTKH